MSRARSVKMPGMWGVLGPWRLEPQTSSASRARSNQLSYGPMPIGVTLTAQVITPRSPNHSPSPERCYEQS
jgi:hypothetical protein